MVDSYQPGGAGPILAGLRSACAEDRWLALWASGSIHDPAALPALQAYLAAHPHGDWLGDRFDLVPVAQAAVAYIQAPRDPVHTYAVTDLYLYPQIPNFAGGAGATASAIARLVPGSAITLLERVATGQSRPDHGGDTPLVFERIQPAGDPRTYYIDISGYVVASPPYFRAPQPELGNTVSPLPAPAKLGRTPPQP